VGWPQIVFGVVLIAALLGVAILYCIRQVRALRGLRDAEAMALEERSHQRRQAWRRLVTCALMFVLALMLAAALLFLEAPAQHLADERAALEGQANPPPLTPQQLPFARFYGVFWIAFLLVLMAIVLLAALDLLATRRYGLRQHRRLQADRRAMIEHELSRLRQERNGHV
jgi:ABC-type Fe3+ transport system permease subunit